MTTLVVLPAKGPLTGSVPVPSDKSIGHRALLFAALCRGKSRIEGFSGGEDNVATANALRAMSIRIDEESKSTWIVEGKGIFGFVAPKAALDCGNSGTTMRLFTGLLAPQPFASTLVGDASLSRRPMARVADPLRKRGAIIEGVPHPSKAGELTAPLRIAGLPEGTYLGPLEYESPVVSAQVKSAILLSGLYAHGPTYVKETLLSRDHTERMMRALGVPIRTVGTLVEIDPSDWNGEMPAFDVKLPGDISAAAFLIVAAQIVAGSQVDVRHVGTNPTRTGILEIARDMGVSVHVEPEGDSGGEPVATVRVSPGSIRGMAIGGEVVEIGETDNGLIRRGGGQKDFCRKGDFRRGIRVEGHPQRRGQRRETGHANFERSRLSFPPGGGLGADRFQGQLRKCLRPGQRGDRPDAERGGLDPRAAGFGNGQQDLRSGGGHSHGAFPDSLDDGD